MQNQVLKVLGVTLVVPLLGVVVSTIVLNNMSAEAMGAVSAPIAYVCSHRFEFSGTEEACGSYGLLRTLQLLSVLAGMIPMALVATQVGLANWAGRRRKAMAATFPVLTRITILSLVAMVLLQAVVAFAAIWIGESEFFGSVHFGIMITLGLGALAAALGLIRAAWASGRRPTLMAVGKALTPQAAPRLFDHVGALAARLGAQPPKHIVVGLEPTFYVTSADVHVLGAAEPLRGETLFLSMTLARLFTPQELDAVIGHELGHFRGEDTAYSLKFAPVYAGLGGAIGAMVDGEGKTAWAAIPALYILGLLHELFAGAEAAVGRDRELEADVAGAEAAGAEALALALLKVTLHAEPWHAAVEEPDFLHGSETADALPAAYAERLRHGFDAAAWRERVGAALEESVAHPIDTHPPVGARLAALGYDVARLAPDSLLPPTRACGVDVIDGAAELEVLLSTGERELRAAFFTPSAETSVPARTTDSAADPV